MKILVSIVTLVLSAVPVRAEWLWPSEPPAGCPFAKSSELVEIVFTGRHAEYTQADTWYPSWASDGKMYSPWTDGVVNGLRSNSAGQNATTGYATIVGDDPLKLQVVDHNVYKSDPAPFQSRYPCGSLVHNGVWYYGTYCLGGGQVIRKDGITYNWPWLGAFVGFRHSSDFGKTWTQTPCTPAKPLFGESGLQGEPVKIGSPHFVDFGKNMEHSPDGKAYLVAHGASDGKERRFGYNSWITGDEIYLLRVTPSVETINDAAAYEFWDGEAWTHDFSRIKPIASWRDTMGCVTMTYNAPLKKYLMCVTDGGTTGGYYNSYVLESDRITGPFKLVKYLHHFGEQAYFVNLPSKFISADGRTLWLCYAANFAASWDGKRIKSNPPGSKYAMCLQEIRLAKPGEPLPESSLASRAKVSASSTYQGYAVAGLVDGVVGGYPGDTAREWCTDGEREGAFVRLAWDEPVTIGKVTLHDRPNDLDQVQAGLLVFSDGSTLPVGELADDGKAGTTVSFPPKSVTWIAFFVTKVKPSTQNIGLSEFEVGK